MDALGNDKSLGLQKSFLGKTFIDKACESAMNEIYQEYFDMMEFTPEELEKEMPRIEKTFKKLGVTEEDLQVCINRVKKSLDITLSGIRKILKFFFTETVNLILADEEYEKLIYCTLPGWGGGLVSPRSHKERSREDDVFQGKPARPRKGRRGCLLRM